METINTKRIRSELIIDAKALDIPIGAAEIFIDHALTAAQKKLKSKKLITKQDLERIIARELKKYNAELAYVYQIRDKII